MKRIVLIAAVVAACGGSSNIAANRNRAGSGSSTLLVTATATVTASDTSPSTTYLVTVKNGPNAGVTGATVSFGAVSLTDAGSGNYTGSLTSYPSGDLSLSVVKGTDNVQGVSVGNPGAHAINAPVGGGSVAVNQPLHISWTTPSVANSARITLSSCGYSAQAADTGAYDVPAASNSQTRTSQRVTVVRSNEVAIAGGLPGSNLNVTVSNQTGAFTVQ